MKTRLKLPALMFSVLCMLCLAGCGAKINAVTLPDADPLPKGETLQLVPGYGTEKEATEEKVAEAAAKLALEWTSSDEAVLTVDENGLVTAVGPVRPMSRFWSPAPSLPQAVTCL